LPITTQLHMEVLNVKIDNLSHAEILEKIESFLAGNKLCQIATVNPEFILAAQKDVEFKNILNDCDLNVADGVGIKFAFWRYGKKLKTRIAGVDLMLEILKMADSGELSVFLVANKDGLSTWEETAEAIRKNYPDLKISGINKNCHSKLVEESNFSRSLNCTRDDTNIINNYDIIFCSFGAPYQEKFLYSLKNLENVKIKLGMGVGGSFDYLTGKSKRAPKWMQKISLEWLFRLILEPRYRMKRIFNAVIIFPIKIIINKKTYDNQDKAN